MRYKTLLLTLIILLISFMSVSAEEVHYYNATGGTVTYIGNYTIHKFTSNSTINVTGVLRNASVLIVAGGGGGGSGGGGAGGLIYNTTFNFTTNIYNLVIGYGGANGSKNGNGSMGGNSSINTSTVNNILLSFGGGGGAKQDLTSVGTPGMAGGSGGGASIDSTVVGNTSGGAGVPGQGYPGGNTTNHVDPYVSAGGGGAGGNGGNANVTGIGGLGGDGLYYNITGNNTCYAGGGGGTYYNDPPGGTRGYATCGGSDGATGIQASNATPNTGGGAGGGNDAKAGGAGGSGIIILRYLTNPVNMVNSTIIPNPLYANNNLSAYCLANTNNGTINYNYTLYLNGAINTTGTVTGFANEVTASVLNITSNYLSIGQTYILQCLAYNDAGVSLPINSSPMIITSLRINVTIYDELNNSLLLENVSVDSSSILESDYNTTTSGMTTVYLSNIGSYTITLGSANYASRTYQLEVTGNQTSIAINARLLKITSSSNFTIYIQDSLNRVVPNSRIIISRAYSGNWTNVVDTYADDGGRIIVPLQTETSYVVTIDAAGFPLKQFVQVFRIASSPYTFRLTTTGDIIYTDVFNDVNYTYTPTNTSVGNDTIIFTFNVFSESDLLEWASITSSFNSTNITDPTLIISSISVYLANQSGEVYPVTYCFKQSSFEQYCFIINYYVEGRGVSGGNLIDTLKSFQDLFSGGTSNGWLTIIAIFGVLIICVVTAQLSGNPVVTTISGFGGMIIFTYLGWLNPILTGFVCVIGLLLFFFNKQGGS